MCHLPFAMLPSSRSLDHGLQLLGAEVQPVRRTKKRLGIPFLIERPQLVTDAVEDHRDERERLAGFMTVEQGLSEQKPTQSLALMGLADSQPGKNRHRQCSAWEVPGQIRRQVAEIDLARGGCIITGDPFRLIDERFRDGEMFRLILERSGREPVVDCLHTRSKCPSRMCTAQCLEPEARRKANSVHTSPRMIAPRCRWASVSRVGRFRAFQKATCSSALRAMTCSPAASTSRRAWATVTTRT